VRTDAVRAVAIQSLLQEAGVNLPAIASDAVRHGALPLMRQGNRLSARRSFLIGDTASDADLFSG
jgi:hypothetical protein